MIKRRSDGKFLRSTEVHYSLHSGADKSGWSSKPAYMLRTPDGVAMNLRKLCSEPYWVKTKFGIEVEWRNFDETKLDQFEVVCMDVDVISMKAMPAEKFAQVEAIAHIPLTRSERQVG
tara:strand:- start:663 stop:1016 length:354 start_codon:yes stop_codon:yes gene_type:complete